LASTRVYLIRHADVENPRRLLYGHLDGFQLSALGRAQAAAVGDSLRDKNVGRIVHSPLARAVETAAIINSRLEPPVRRPLWFVHKTRRGLVPGDESVEQMGDRILGVVRRIVREHPGDTMAVVSHADPLQAVWVVLDGRPHNEREMYRKSIDKAGMLVLDLEGEKAVRWEYVPPPQVEKPAGVA